MSAHPRNLRQALPPILTIASLAFGCATSPPPKALAERPSVAHDEPTSNTKLTSANGPGICTLVCETAELVTHPADSPDYSARALANANQVLEAMNADLLGCYKSRVAVNPQAHGFITVDIVIDPEGHVQRTETTGGAVLGESTMRCLVKRIQRATFERPHGGGTLHIHVPFSLRRVGPDETL